MNPSSSFPLQHRYRPRAKVVLCFLEEFVLAMFVSVVAVHGRLELREYLRGPL